MAIKKKIRIGVVGIGHLGSYHLQKYSKMEACQIVAASDTQIERAQKVAELYGCEALSDHKNMIGKVDAVSIAVPTGFHHAVARDFLAAGVDVLIEKPICATVEEADELVALAQKNNLVFQVGFVERFNPVVMALEQVLTRPVFIEVHRLHPFFERGTDVDVILDLMIHDLDIILKFVTSPLTNVEAVGVPVLSDKIDISNVRLSFACGCIANVTASRISAKTMQKLRFLAPKDTMPWILANARFCRLAKRWTRTAKSRSSRTTSKWAATIRWKRKSGPLSVVFRDVFQAGRFR